jgi:hypothetical protein
VTVAFVMVAGAISTRSITVTVGITGRTGAHAGTVPGNGSAFVIAGASGAATWNASVAVAGAGASG